MSHLLSLHTASIQRQEPKHWRDSILEKLRKGARVITLYGQKIEDRVLVTAIIEEAQQLHALRTKVSPEFGFHEMTSDFPALHCFERELHEQTGVRIAGHPWLKPIRYEGREQSAMNQYPFYKIEGKEVHEVAVGPIHAGVIEPGSFRFMCHGEQVHHLEIHLGYQHRGVEALLLKQHPLRLAPLVETIAGDTSVAHSWAYCAAIEALTESRASEETEVARAVALELERIAMHLAGLSGLAADIGFLQGATTYGRLRTTAINTTMRLCGSRFGRGAIRPGAQPMRLTAELLPEIKANIALLRKDLEIINDCFLAAQTVSHRLKGVGVLTEMQAKELGVVGMAARASNVLIDLRASATEGVYQRIPVVPAVLDSGDCWARGLLRIREMNESLSWLDAALEKHPTWSTSRGSLGELRPHTLVVSRVEGWRGEVVHCVETNGEGALSLYKVQDPSLRNWMGLAIAVRQNEISDFPICNKSFDLSYCGNDL